MKLTVRYFSLFLIIAVSFGNFAYGQKKIADEDLPNFSQINANLYRGGQPSEEGVKKLKQMGVKTIIYLRDADERARIEESWAQAAGIKFYNVPLSNWFGPKDAQVEKVLGLINAPENQPVFVHCKRGADRTGTVVAVYRITRDGWTAKQANEEAEKFDFGWWQIWMKDYIKDYFRDFKKQN